MKEYGDLLADDPEWAERAGAFAARVRDVSELIKGRVHDQEAQPRLASVVYHDACHLAHAQGIRTEPWALLASIPGLEVLEPAGWEICCGSAGIYNLTQPEAAHDLGRRKAENLLATGAEAIVSANPGCTLQITAHLEEMGHSLPVFHPMEILHASIEGRTP